MLSIQKWSVQPQLFTCDWSFHIAVGSLLTACSGSTQALQSICRADVGQLLFQPLADHFISVEAFWFPDVAVEDVEATNQSTGEVVVVCELVCVAVHVLALARLIPRVPEVVIGHPVKVALVATEVTVPLAALPKRI